MNKSSRVFKDFYQTMEVSFNAKFDEIHESYNKLALKWHPDKHPSNKGYARRRFHEISQIYEILIDDKKRHEYNKFLDHTLEEVRKSRSEFFTFKANFSATQLSNESESKCSQNPKSIAILSKQRAKYEESEAKFIKSQAEFTMSLNNIAFIREPPSQIETVISLGRSLLANVAGILAAAAIVAFWIYCGYILIRIAIS